MKFGPFDHGDLADGREGHAVDEGAADVPWIAGGLVVRPLEDRFARRGAAADRRPQEAVVRQPLDGLHGRFVACTVGLRVEFEAALLEIGDMLVADLREQHRLERQLLRDVAVERPRTGPEDRALSGAERLVAVGDVACRNLVLVEQVEHPLHRGLAGVGIDAGALQIVAGALEAHLLSDDAPGDGRLHARAGHHDAGAGDLVAFALGHRLRPFQQRRRPSAAC